MRNHLPVGRENSINELMTPDLQFAFQIVAAHKRAVNAQWSYPEHHHTMFELNMVLEGDQTMIADSTKFVQQVGDILFIPPGVLHSSSGSTSQMAMTYFCLHFDIDDLTLRRSLMGMHTTLLPASNPSTAAIRSTLERLLQRLQYAQTGLHLDKLAFLSDTFLMLSALTNWTIEEGSGEVHGIDASENEVSLAASIERELRSAYAANRSSEDRISIEKLASRLGYSPSYCNRVFQRVYGMTPRQYLTGLIVRQAKLLLINSELTIEDIAYQLGYRDISQFSKQFKRWMNLSPAAFRKLTK
ncbi:AraC-like DNA-binding protein/mannose-6-phosphate isomerase-like protein (cupin superfamily) [Paenibacillus castaneae]|uniref:AraC family transcriptional regulator n=1 Tax=Paenibacillus castaneae TaxID=474957 RepID=UPI00141B1B2E|nr:AraC family transcriptional regulator [Paenibacillus castaneae]NIK76198.1 AraC-like DNA-binding protein/mannose-6-phosphate isomerase-like protein (cupin superfamily) [Paenibacillus castaneae]